jgi:outer membrane protein OmpA-like peptidoglycan-associated protein
MRRENGKWTKPKNIGAPINTSGDEIGLFVSTNGKQAYFSGRQQSDWNIYSFELYEEARPKEVVILKGELKDDNGNPIKDAQIEINYTESGTTEKIKVNGDDGKFAAVVKVNPKLKEDILITATTEGHSFETQIISKESLNPNTVSIQTQSMKVEKLEEGKNFEIDNLLFDSQSSEIKSESKLILDGFARYLKQNPSLIIEIQGHTDDLGDDKVNLILSENRCKVVKEYLISKGANANNLYTKGFGETQPKFANDNDSNRAKNRRTEVRIKKLN